MIMTLIGSQRRLDWISKKFIELLKINKKQLSRFKMTSINTNKHLKIKKKLKESFNYNKRTKENLKLNVRKWNLNYRPQRKR